jgi:hypothetical protein
MFQDKSELNTVKSVAVLQDDTVCYGKITNLTLRSKVTNNGTQHIVWRWSTYMPNMKNLSWTTKKLQPGHDLLRMQGPIWPWGQNSRSKVTNNGTRHIVWRWSTYMPNMKSLSWTTKKLQPGHDLLWMHRPVWPWGQRSPTMTCDTSSGGGLPTYQICKTCLERQKSYSPDTICYGRTDWSLYWALIISNLPHFLGYSWICLWL